MTYKNKLSKTAISTRIEVILEWASLSLLRSNKIGMEMGAGSFLRWCVRRIVNGCAAQQLNPSK
jgi:hypothetical protein